MGHKLTIAFTRREAELYCSQGLFEEAQQLYRDVLNNSDRLGGRLSKSLQAQIVKIEDELAALEVDLVEVVSEKEMNILKDGWQGANTPTDILTCATALGDVGLFEAAVEEYRKLIRLKLPVTHFIRGLTDCLLGIHSLATIENAIGQIIPRDLPHGNHPATMRAAFALDMERRGHYLTALHLFKNLLKDVPQTHWVAIAKKIKSLKVKMKTRDIPAATAAAAPVCKPVDKSARFHRRVGQLRKHLNQLRALVQRQRQA
ncbi:MAG: hypothetical protein JJV98_21195 [Desulfosarcina sp.]|nr:hypothetical protein [Desulfobacterales bacterium]